MRMRADQKLFLTYLVLIAGITLATSFGAESLLRRQLLATIEGSLRRELLLSRALYESYSAASADSLAHRISELSGHRVTIIGVNGRVIGESAGGLEAPPQGDYRSRPEVATALRVGEGVSIRRSATLGRRLLYYAMRNARGEVVRIAMPLDDIDRTIAGVQRGILSLAAIALALAVLFSLGFSVVITRPLRQIGDSARALAAGDLSRRTRIRREDELGELAHTLDLLASELQRRLNQLEGERTEMQTLIDAMAEGVLAISPGGEVRRANPAARHFFGLEAHAGPIPIEMISRNPLFLESVRRALRGREGAARELVDEHRSYLLTAQPLPEGGAVLVVLDTSELRRLESVRRDFVANASHELKTPLTAIRGFSETLLDPDLPPELARQFAGIIHDHARRLQQIVDDLLDLSRIEAGAWRLEVERLALAPLVGEVWTAERAGRPERAIELQTTLAPDAAFVEADPAALRQILSNLIGNALRHTPAGGTIRIRSRPAGAPEQERGLAPAAGKRRWTILEVQDTGAGIASVHLPRIFERFYRADRSRAREDGGTGLGLSIVRHLVEAHGGGIEAESELDRGTTIRFGLPAG